MAHGVLDVAHALATCEPGPRRPRLALQPRPQLSEGSSKLLLHAVERQLHRTLALVGLLFCLDLAGDGPTRSPARACGCPVSTLPWAVGATPGARERRCWARPTRLTAILPPLTCGYTRTPSRASWLPPPHNPKVVGSNPARATTLVRGGSFAALRLPPRAPPRRRSASAARTRSGGARGRAALERRRRAIRREPVNAVKHQRCGQPCHLRARVNLLFRKVGQRRTARFHPSAARQNMVPTTLGA